MRRSAAKGPSMMSMLGLFASMEVALPFGGNAVDAAWLAGIIDGEGTINAYFREPRKGGSIVGVQLQVVNTDKEIIDRILTICPAARATVSKRDAPRKPIYHVWVVRRTELISILAAVQPYLTGRKMRRAELALKYLESRAQWGSGKGHQHTVSELDLLVAIKETK